MNKTYLIKSTTTRPDGSVSIAWIGKGGFTEIYENRVTYLEGWQKPSYAKRYADKLTENERYLIAQGCLSSSSSCRYDVIEKTAFVSRKEGEKNMENTFKKIIETNTDKKILVAINSHKVNASCFAYDGCHKIYICRSDYQMRKLERMEYDIRPIEWLEETYNFSCGLRFIADADLRKPEYCEQFVKARFLYAVLKQEDGLIDGCKYMLYLPYPYTYNGYTSVPCLSEDEAERFCREAEREL